MIVPLSLFSTGFFPLPVPGLVMDPFRCGLLQCFLLDMPPSSRRGVFKVPLFLRPEPLVEPKEGLKSNVGNGPCAHRMR